MSAPRATLRLQFNSGFTLDDAVPLAPYFAALGVSHLYASPILTACAGSVHGYDVVDPTRVDSQLGGEDALRRLVAALREAELGLIVDIVPNHMAIGNENPWWLDVLAHGRESRYARFFDIDWEVEDLLTRRKVLLPVLGRPYGEALEAGELTIEQQHIRYFDHLFPLTPSSARECAPLHEVLNCQHYRLAWWRVANDEINWRRFFDINDLIGLRMEDDDVFEATHATLFRLYQEGLIDGVRVDHVDGLADPSGYCRKLRARLDALEPSRPADVPRGRAYFVVEKILAADEQLPDDWGCDGTTGYDFMDQVSAALHDPRGEPALSELWGRVSGRPPYFPPEEQVARREIIARSFSAPLGGVVRAFHRLARGNLTTRDVSRAALRRVLIEVLAHFPVYRLYAAPNRASAADLSFLNHALAAARRTCLPADRPMLDLMGRWLAGEETNAQTRDLQAAAMTRFHQLSAPVCAKAVEDTAFYRYGRLLSRNDVGFDPARFADTPRDFHARMAARCGRFPAAMLASATHDHKRGEDVRARLASLSELAEEWATALERWIARSEPLQQLIDGTLAPMSGDLAMLFQTIVGAWPPDLALANSEGLRAFAERLVRWQEKALREAKLVTDWSEPNEPYESAARDFIMRLFANELPDLLADIAAFAERIAPAGAANGLAQCLLKLTAPGVPDFYQGTDYWDLSLVDPDNRHPVDYAVRAASLGAGAISDLAQHWRDGRIKQAVIARALAVRRKAPKLFARGAYRPLEIEGALADHVIAFARELDDLVAVTLVCRLPARLLGRQRHFSLASARWKDTRLRVPSAWRGMAFRDVLCGTLFQKIATDPAAIFAHLPVALLVKSEESLDLFNFAAAHDKVTT